MYAYSLLGQKLPRNIRDIDVWHIFLNGKDIAISQFYNGAFINSPLPLKCELDLAICMPIRNDIKEEKIRKKEARKDAIQEKEEKYTKVHIKFNQMPVHKTLINKMPDKSIHIETKKRKGGIVNKKNKEQKDESMFIEEEDDEEICWDPSKNIWTQNDLDYFLGRFPENAPVLLRIIEEYRSNSVPRDKCNPIYRCIFQHPKTMEEKDICLGRPILKRIQQYKPILDAFEI